MVFGWVFVVAIIVYAFLYSIGKVEIKELVITLAFAMAWITIRLIIIQQKLEKQCGEGK
jgi:hypothetical protein